MFVFLNSTARICNLHISPCASMGVSVVNRNRNKNKNRNNNSNSNSNNDNNRQNRLNQNNSQQHLKDKEKCNVNEVESVEITTKATTQLPVSAESVSVVNLAIDETNERDDVTASNTIAHIGNEVHLLSKEPKPTIGTSSTVSFEHTKGNEAIIGYGQAKSVDPNENMGNNKSKEVEHINMPNPVNGETITNTNDILLESNLQKQPVEGKIIVHRVLYEGENEANNSIASNLSEHTKQNSIGPLKKPIVHNIHIDLEEDDEKPYDDECKEEITNRSQVEICEVNEDIITNDLPIVQSPIVTEVESESEDLAKIEFQDDAVKTSDHIFQYDENLDTRQRSKQKKLAIQNHFLPHFLNPRYLDSITEENSDLSDYSDKVKSPLQPLKDPLKTKTLNCNSFMQATSTPLIVETRITETPGADESCSILECSQAVKPEAAETIFINSASSSITDLLDYENMETNSRTVHDTDTVNISSKSQSEETPANKKTPTAIPTLTTTTISDLQPDCIDDKQIVQIAENMIMRSSSPRNIENASANSNDLVATSVVLSSSEHMPINPIAERNENFENSVALISSSSNGCETLNSILSVDHKTKQQILFENEMNNVRALLISENSLNTNGKRSSDILQNNNNNNSNNNNNNNITILTKDSPPTPTLSLTTASESIIVKLNSDPVHRNSDTHLDENNCSAGKTINADTTKSNKSVTDAQSSISDVNGATCTLKQHGNAATNLYFTYPEKLRILCAEKLESLPYGHAVLEELAKISQNIGEAKAVTSIRQTSASSKDVKMPYPLPSMPHIKDLQLHLQSRQEGTNTLPSCKPEEKLHSQTWTGIPTNSDPKVLVCISPSQRSYMEKHVEQQPDDLLSAHQKFIERRGYYEYTKSEIEAMEEEKRAEKDVLQMAAHMKKLRKSLTPTPPPIPPPPVPTKSLETSVKALNSMNQAITGDMKKATEKNSRNNADSVNKEENIKHLLEILNNTNEANQKQIPDIMSSLPENSSRQTNYKVDGNVSGMPGTPQTNANKHSQQRDHFNASDRYRKDSSNMEIGFKLKPTYSETLPLNFESKSYSKMETSSYEAKKRIENGKIVCDTSESKYDKRIETDSNNNSKSNSINNKRESNESNFSKSEQNKTKTQTTDATNKLKEPIPPYGIEIMSDIKLNNISEITKETKNSAHSIALDWDYEKNMKSDAATEHQEHRKTNVENEAQNLCKEFRQNAKTSDLLDRLNTKTSATTNVIKDQVTSQPSLSSSSSFTSDHEKLLKEFDELSKRLHNELETNSWQKRQRELSSSMFDLSTLQMKQKQHFEEFKRRRHEHMKELEKEIEKSIKSRQLKFAEKLQNGQVHNVPIRIETDDIQNDSSFIDAKEGNNRENSRVYQIPIKIENTQNDRQLLRSESMFNLGEEQHKRVHKPYANHNNQVDSNVNNWTKQRQDFGLSENITRPFAREVEICYQRQSPRVIRAPRLNDAPNDSSLESNVSTSHHTSKRFSAPMFTERERPSHHASCYSMIERDPHPTYISTTTRRGVSPAPTQVSGNQPDVSQRRDSLPKSFHDQKLKHLSDKENALRAEFEQLQNERRRLLEEIQTGESSSHSSAFNTMHETYRSMQRLPTLTENEVFRQQMAEEWLSKVAEREKRRLQKVVKISKISDNSETFNKSTSTLTSTGQATDVGSEFLKRVKERRSKLAIPADSDWESGAESQPINQSQTSEAEDVSSVKFIEGKAEAKPSQLPKHLREFAKFSTAQQDQLDGNDQKEHFEEEEQSSEITENSISKALKKSWMTKTVKVSRSSRDNGQDQKDGGNQLKPNLTTRRKTSSKQKHGELTNTHNCKRLSCSESDLLNEIDKDLKLAKGFLFKDEDVRTSYTLSPKFKAKALCGTGIWSPKNETPSSSFSNLSEIRSEPPTPPPPPSHPVWTPKSSPQVTRKEFRPIQFESPRPSRKFTVENGTEVTQPPWNRRENIEDSANSENINISASTAKETRNFSESQVEIKEILSSDITKGSVLEKIKTFEKSSSASDVNKSLDNNHRTIYKPNDVLYNVKHVYMSEPESINECPKKMAQLGRRLCDGIGPVTNDGMPIVLRSEVKEPHQHEWYKRLYQTIHKQKHGDDYLIRYKCPRGRKLQQYSGYQSEPEPAKETDYSTIKYRTTNPQRLVSVSSNVNLRNSTSNNSFHGLTSEPIKSGYGTYKNQPGRIENYITGHSSISEKEKKRQLDQTKLSSHANDGNLARALSLESGYTSDSNLVFRKKEATQSSTLGPIEQKIAYRNVQAGGEPPLYGFRKPAPEKLKVSPNLYHESDVSIYFKTPVCQEPRSPPMTDEELASRQAEYMQKLYQEERRRKYLQELQDMNARRHTDNFTPSQKSPIALNRYDDFPADLAPKSPLKQDLQTKAVARALYNFQGQNPRELCFKKGDIIYIRRTIDKNWYEGERNAMVGLFPANYVEIISRGEIQYLKQQTRQKPSEGQARAKYNFQAQSGIELSLNKGELVSLTRRVDENWFEGRIANRKGIFPVAYVEVLIDIGAEDVVTRTDRTTHRHMDTLRSNINQEFNTLIRHGYHTQTGTNNYFPKGASQKNKTDILHVDTNVEPIVYRALYKYQPQNSDELELFEGDLVHVLEKCDDGWYVGTSQRTGCFGTFPGNYVERI
ncbi:uncharacterized protein ACN427_002170 isoform 3-T3 [Glossina fuscipes fuscipes]